MMTTILALEISRKHNQVENLVSRVALAVAVRAKASSTSLTLVGKHSAVARKLFRFPIAPIIKPVIIIRLASGPPLVNA